MRLLVCWIAVMYSFHVKREDITRSHLRLPHRCFDENWKRAYWGNLTPTEPYICLLRWTLVVPEVCYIYLGLWPTLKIAVHRYFHVYFCFFGGRWRSLARGEIEAFIKLLGTQCSSFTFSCVYCLLPLDLKSITSNKLFNNKLNIFLCSSSD